MIGTLKNCWVNSLMNYRFEAYAIGYVTKMIAFTLLITPISYPVKLQ